ncbi:MAG: SMI1/KNR4 family protein [Isosphaeraceae bacterium]|nr:SMI1/KNR4 family protein [Isosphaeraceae bacterium]
MARRSWRELVERLTPDCEFSPPATIGQLAAVERALGVALPDDLRGLLVESNGIAGQYGLGLVWPVERIEADNLAFRSNADFRELYMPFDHLLFFADAGNGDQFAYAVLAGEVRRDDVFVWNHEDDSRTWAAPSLERYLEWWLSGQLKV